MNTNTDGVSAMSAELDGRGHTVERLIAELGEVSEVSIHRQATGRWFVSIRPNNRAPLWWHANRSTLLGSLLACREDAVRMRFLPPNTSSTTPPVA
jgi:hypothetical protein